MDASYEVIELKLTGLGEGRKICVLLGRFVGEGNDCHELDFAELDVAELDVIELRVAKPGVAGLNVA